MMMRKLPTKTGRSMFRYERQDNGALRIEYGSGKNVVYVTADQLRRLLDHFRGSSVPLGTSRDLARPESVGAWLQKHVTKTAIASYVGPILVHEGWAEWGDSDVIRFSR